MGIAAARPPKSSAKRCDSMHPWFGKFVIGGVGSAVLGASLLGASATNAFAAGATASDKHADRRAVAMAVFTSEAGVLGVKPEELRAALKSGKTLEQLAA